MKQEETMREDQERKAPTPTKESDQRQEERTGEYGGDDGALEHERAEITPGEDPGITATPREAPRPKSNQRA